MQILISALSSARYPSGICRHAANLANDVAGTGEVSRITLLVGRWQVKYFREAFGIRGTKLRVVAVDVENNAYARNIWYYFSLSKIARECGADLVHLSFPAPVRRSAFACPLVVSLHDLYPYDAPSNFGGIRVMFNRAFLRQCLDASDAIVCSSDFTLERLRLRAPELVARKALRIYQSVALNPNERRAPANEDLRRSPFLLAVAQHRSNKNLGLLLTAFAEFRRHKAYELMRLLIVGAEGPETGKLRSLVQRLALGDFVAFQSSLLDAELCWLYHHCELLVVPSVIEGFCFPVVEALRCGTRVLCSDIPVLREVGGGLCNFVELNQERPATALSAAIQATLHHPVPQSGSAHSFQSVDAAREYCALYSSLLTANSVATTRAQLSASDSVRYDGYAS